MENERADNSRPEALRGKDPGGTGRRSVPWRVEGLAVKSKGGSSGGHKRRFTRWVSLAVLYLGFFLVLSSQDVASARQHRPVLRTCPEALAGEPVAPGITGGAAAGQGNTERS